MPLIISDEIRAKLLAKHDVTEKEVREAISNRNGRLLEDNREQHKTTPPTQWLVAPTNRGRLLKVVFVQQGANVYLRTAFPPSDAEKAIYAKFGSGTI